MITFYQLGQNGRLGNQLFQYAALRATSLLKGYESMIPDFNQRNWHGQNCLLGNFNLKSKTFSPQDLEKIRHQVIQKDSFLYYPDIRDILDFSNLSGHFVHLDYFMDFKDEIFEEFSFKEEVLAPEVQYINEIKQDNFEIVSLHVRRGDNTDGTNPEYSEYLGDNPFDRSTKLGRFISDSIDSFGSRKVKFLVLAGGSRSGDNTSDIKWAMEKFSDERFIISTSNNAISDFIRITLCDHNIVSFTSSFSLWASYLNRDVKKTVICPGDFWLIHQIDPEKHKIFMDHWTIL